MMAAERKLTVGTKLWFSTCILGGGFLAFLLFVQWTCSQTQMHLRVASDGLFPAALSSQEAEGAFQKLSKRYNNAVVLQDSKEVEAADQDAQSVTASLERVKGKIGFNAARQSQVGALIIKFSDLKERSRSTYTAAILSKDAMSEDLQHSLIALAQDNKDMELSLQQLRDALSKDFQSELDAVTLWSGRAAHLWDRTVPAGDRVLSCRREPYHQIDHGTDEQDVARSTEDRRRRRGPGDRPLLA